MPIRELCLHLNRRCNWFCDHCYYGSSSSDSLVSDYQDPIERPSVHGDMPMRIAQDIVYQCRPAGVQRVTLQGGEPFLYPHLRDVAETVKEQGMLAAIPTNGVLIDDRALEWIPELLDFIFISIHGPREFHDEFVHARGAFDRSMRAAIACHERGVRTAVISSVSERNIGSILELTKQLDDVGVPMHGVFYQTEAGRGAATQSLTAETWETFIDKARCVQSGLQIRMRFERTRVPMDSVESFATSLPGEALPALMDDQIKHGGCQSSGGESIRHVDGGSCVTCLGVEKHICFCNTEGDFYNCSLLMDQEHYRFGSYLRGATLSDYFSRIDWGWAYSKSPLPQECIDCEFLNICHGGCMAARGPFNRNLNGRLLCENKTRLPVCVLYPDIDVYEEAVQELARA